MEKKITLFGHELNIKFNMAVQLSYEQITGKAFNIAELHSTRNRIALYYAAIIANNEGVDITIDYLFNCTSVEPISTIDKAISECMIAWYAIPQAAEDATEEEEEDDSKKD